jgi:dimethylaniline monooxygenase (N-oxide forming)
VTKQLYEICDFPHAAVERGHYPKGIEVQNYLEAYANENKLNDVISLNTTVEKAERKADGCEGWILSTKDSTGATKSEEVDYLVVSSGLYSTPNVPTFEGEDKFEGEILHSSKYTESSMAKAKNVIVVGGSKSAIECLLDSSKVSNASTLVYREAHWGSPRKIAGIIPFQWIFLSRFGQGLVSWRKGAWPGSPASVGTAHKLLSPLMVPVFAIVEALIGFQLGFRGEFKPKDDIVKDFYGYGHVLDNSFKEARNSNTVNIAKGAVKSLTKNSVILTCGKEIPCDLIVCGTGYKRSYEYLDSDILKALNIEKDGMYLYRHCLPLNVPNLAFVGSEVATISNIATYGIMAEWLARVLKKTMTLPPADVMVKEVEEMKEWKRYYNCLHKFSILMFFCF